ncbi:hypothetical protein U9M48_009569 [Paspalum notatum var. saurae]|uniref:Uncharacterized protein n=1 Tax=Paspalum notatum var. saurae TaxID=547442 RepID=A0AAQ3SSU0_PASNO
MSIPDLCLRPTGWQAQPAGIGGSTQPDAGKEAALYSWQLVDRKKRSLARVLSLSSEAEERCIPLSPFLCPWRRAGRDDSQADPEAALLGADSVKG